MGFSVRDVFGKGGLTDISGGSALGAALGPVGGVLGGVAGGQSLIDLIRGKGSRSAENVFRKSLDPTTTRGGFFAGAGAGAGTGAAFGPIGAIVGGVAGGVLGSQQARKGQAQAQAQEQDRARIEFEAKRSREQLNESLLEQTRTRARFSSNQSGSLLTG